MNSDVTLTATVTRHSGMAYTLQGALLAHLVLVEQVLLHIMHNEKMDRRVASLSFTGSDGVADQLECQVFDIMHNEKMDRRVASLSFTGSDGVADQLECQVLEVVLAVRELLENFFGGCFLWQERSCCRSWPSGGSRRFYATISLKM